MQRMGTRRRSAWPFWLLVVASAAVALATTASGSALAQVPETPAEPAEPAVVDPIVGDVPPPGGLALLAVGSQEVSRDGILSALAIRGCLATSLGLTANGQWQMFSPRAPEFASGSFPTMLAADLPFIVRCDHQSINMGGSPPATQATISPAQPYGVQHVIFGRTQLDLLTTGAWSPYVHDDRDAFMLMSGNISGRINCDLLNRQAAEVREYHPTAPMYAATSGLRNVREGVTCLDTSLFAGLIMVYEPGQENATEFSWDQARTEQSFYELALLARAYGLESWTKISGRATAGRDQFGIWDYGELGYLLSGQIIQTQGSCRDSDENGDFTDGPRDFRAAIESIREMYVSAGVSSRIFIRVTASSVEANRNAVSAEAAMQCAMAAWELPGVDRVTLRTGVGDVESIEAGTEFLRLREQLLP